MKDGRVYDGRVYNDSEVIIDKLTKQKQYLQFQCRKAGDTIKGYQILVEEHKKEIWELKKSHKRTKKI